MPAHLVVASSDPAATGAEHAYTATEDLIIKSFAVALVTDGNAANRQVNFTAEDSGGNIYWKAVAADVQAASVTRTYTAYAGYDVAPVAVEDTTFVLPLPEEGLLLPKNGVLRTVTTSIQATDNYGKLVMFAERQ